MVPLRLPCTRHLDSKISALGGLSTSYSSSQDFTQPGLDRTPKHLKGYPKEDLLHISQLLLVTVTKYLMRKVIRDGELALAQNLREYPVIAGKA